MPSAETSRGRLALPGPGAAAHGGFSLVELLVAASLLALVAGLAAPGLADWAHAARLKTHAYNLLFDLHLARSEAIRRNGRVTLCKSADGERCAEEGGWEQGVIVFEDRNHNAEREPGEPVLHHDAPFPPGYRARGNGTVKDFVSYASIGVARTPSGAFQAGTISVCRSAGRPADAWQVVVNAGGRPRAQKLAATPCG